MFGYLKRFKKVTIIFIFILFLTAVFFSFSCNDNRNEEQKAYDFIEYFDRRIFSNIKGGIHEYDTAKKITNFEISVLEDERLKYYTKALDHFHNARTFFERVKISSSGIRTLDEDSKKALEELIIASEFYLESVDIYLRAVKKSSEDIYYDYDEAIQQTHALEYRAEKKILNVHLSIKDFEKKYPEIFTEEWEAKLNELIQEQENKIIKIKELYEVND